MRGVHNVGQHFLFYNFSQNIMINANCLSDMKLDKSSWEDDDYLCFTDNTLKSIVIL